MSVPFEVQYADVVEKPILFRMLHPFGSPIYRSNLVSYATLKNKFNYFRKDFNKKIVWDGSVMGIEVKCGNAFGIFLDIDFV